MTFKTRIKFFSAMTATLALAACSGGSDYYDARYSGSDDYYSSAYYGGAYDQSAYGMNASGGCMPGYGGQYGQYAGGMTSGGLRYGGGGSYAEYSGKKTRYGSWEYSQSGASGCVPGYWTVPTYHIIQTAAPVQTVETPVVTTTPSITLESCPDGQYRMDNGDCAIMITEETEQYVPPTIGYPTIEQAPIEWYEPVRK